MILDYVILFMVLANISFTLATLLSVKERMLKHEAFVMDLLPEPILRSEEVIAQEEAKNAQRH